MGLTGLTAVFGMGTGGTPSVCSPEMSGAGDQTRHGRVLDHSGRHASSYRVFVGMTDRRSSLFTTRGPSRMGIRRRVIDRRQTRSVNDATRNPVRVESPRGAGGRIGVVKRLAVRTGRLRRSLAVHSRPIDLVVFQEPSHLRAGNLVLKRASRLDAFSAYPFPT